MLALTVFFFLRPRIGRWYVIPYFVVLGVNAAGKFFHSEPVSLQLFFGLMLTVHLVSAVMLFRIPNVRIAATGKECASQRFLSMKILRRAISILFFLLFLLSVLAAVAGPENPSVSSPRLAKTVIALVLLFVAVVTWPKRSSTPK